MEKKGIFMAVTVFTGAALAALGVVYLFKCGSCITDRIICCTDKTKDLDYDAAHHENGKQRNQL